ncbi:hypothetical protein [Emticicia sp. SJ17W-69]|uniref:hypothetical protein n=1 Tax=Emticicia sp. SJ17W-69 TaxID=3421657 RepID=UPI003EBD3806
MKKFTLTALLITLLQVIFFVQTKSVDLLIKVASIINIYKDKVADNQVIVVKNESFLVVAQ